MQQLTYSSKSK